MRALLFLTLLLCAFSMNAQVTFSYDASGNRTSGNIIVTRASSYGNDISEAQPDGQSITKIILSPNPTKGIVNIHIPEIGTNASLQIYSFDGKLLLKQPIKETYHDVDISQYSKGIYLFYILNGDRSETWKIIKE